MNDGNRNIRSARPAAAMRRLLHLVAAVCLSAFVAMAILGLSGMIIFADIRTPDPTALADRALQSAPPMSGAER